MSSNIIYLVLDIETIPDENLIRAVKYPADSFETPTGATERFQQELLEKSQGRSDFIPTTFQLPVSLAYAALNENFEIVKLGTLDRGEYRPHKIAEQFWGLWNKYKPTVVTFNGKGFDVPLLELCAFRYGIAAPAWFNFRGPLNTQPRYKFNLDKHFDLMDFMGNFGSMTMVGGLHLCATLLAKPGKMDTKGSMVWDLWQQNEKVRIDDYCLCDVMDTYFAFLRSQVLLGNLSLENEHDLVIGTRSRLFEESKNYTGLVEYLEKFALWEKPTDEHSGFFNLSQTLS